MNKKGKTVSKRIVLIIIVVAIFVVFVQAEGAGVSLGNTLEDIDDAPIRNFSLFNLVNRSIYSDTYYNETNKEYLSRIYLTPINMKNLFGEFEPYEDLTDLSFDGKDLILKWNDKLVKLEVYTKDKNDKKEKLKDKSIEKKNELKFKTNIEKRRGAYYFNHTLVKDKQKQPKKVGYDIITENTNCVVDGYSLICDEQKIDFSQAVFEQNLGVEINNNYIEIFGDDLSYIDPSVTFIVNESNGGWGKIEFDNSTTTYNYDNQSLLHLGADFSTKNVRAWVIFDVDSIDDSADIDDVDLFLFLDGNPDVSGCNDSDIDVRFYEVDKEKFNVSPTTQDEMSELYGNISEDGDDFYGAISNLNASNGSTSVSKDLGLNANFEVESLIDGTETDGFMVGMRLEPDDENDFSGNDDCFIDFQDGVNDPSLPYIIVTYTILDTTKPQTFANMTSPPEGASYTFESLTNDTVQVNLSCSDVNGSGCKINYPKYCLDDTNTCTPLTTYSTSINISTGGISYIRYRSKDNFNNSETIDSGQIIINRNYTQNVSLFVNDVNVWNQTDYFARTETSDDFTDELNNALDSCTADAQGYCDIPIIVHSDSEGRINITDINIYYNITEYVWDTTGLAELSTYKVRVKVTDGLLNSSWDESDSDFTIEVELPTDPNKFYHQNSSGDAVAWLGNEGNIVLSGSCFSGGNCDSPGDESLIFRNSTIDYVAFINSTGDLCVETGDCSDNSASCSSPVGNSFIVRNSSLDYVSYFDSTGDLCLIGGMFENADL